MDQQWHSMDIGDVVSSLGVDPSRGLSSEEAVERLRRHGPNRIREAKGRGILESIMDQFKSILVLILIVAAALSILMGRRPMHSR